MKHLIKPICASLLYCSLQAANKPIITAKRTVEKPTIVNETDKDQKLVIYHARYYEKDRPIKTQVSLAAGASMVLPWEKAYEEGKPKIYDLQKIELYTGRYIAWELAIMDDAVTRALLAHGIVYIAIEPNVKADAQLKLVLTPKGKEEYLALSDQGKKNFRDLGIRLNLTEEEIKKYHKKELQNIAQLPSPLAGIISEYAAGKEGESNQ